MKQQAVKIFISFYQELSLAGKFYSLNKVNEQIIKFYSYRNATMGSSFAAL